MIKIKNTILFYFALLSICIITVSCSPELDEDAGESRFEISIDDEEFLAISEYPLQNSDLEKGVIEYPVIFLNAGVSSINDDDKKQESQLLVYGWDTSSGAEFTLGLSEYH